MTHAITPGHFSEETSAETVNARIGAQADARLAEVMRALVRHLHGFIKEVELTQAEWDTAIGFPTRTGQICDDTRQEFILLSDVLGASMLVDAIGYRGPPGATENAVLGPFHVDGAPRYETGADISLDGGGERWLFEGRVRGLDDGPVGQLLGRLGRHPYRPAHIHFIVSAEGSETVVTHTFVAGDACLSSDAVFGVKSSLIAGFEPVVDGGTRWRSEFDFVLVPVQPG